MVNNMKKLAWMGTFLLVAMMGCKDDENGLADPIPLPELKVSAVLSGASQVPANASTATGSVNGTVDQESRILSLNVMYSDSADSLFSPTAWRIYKGGADTTGAAVIDFGTTFSSPFAFKDTLSEEQLTDLKAGSYYVNIHTAKFPNGEIRGQLKTEE
jgi:hypothetical protein